ncbi:MAG: translation initiation factor [Candidatus Aenigmarchaeota archaeon]|nr:translation initiation factor [Candidatus Aenigmarchaeota archaeon]
MERVVCPKCGLPQELCVCESIAKETQRIRVRVVKKSFKKTMTLIEGLDAETIDVKALLKKLKSTLACGGTWKENTMELQGDHRERVKKLLKEEGFPEDSIEIR